MFFSSIKEINTLISKGISNICLTLTKWSNTLKQFVGNLSTNCLSVFDHFVGLAPKGLKVTTQKNRRSQNFDFLSLKKFVSETVVGELQFTQISFNFKTSSCNLKIWEQSCVLLFYYFYFKKKNFQRVHAFCWTKIKTLIKTKRNRKWKIQRTVLERRTLCFNSYKNRKLKLKLWQVGARKRKKRAYRFRLFCSKEIFLTLVFYLNI